MITSICPWHYNIGSQHLGVDDIQVWHASLKCSLQRRRQLLVTLSEDEIARAKRFKFQIHRDRFIVARGTLREILSVYTNTDPKDVAFAYAAYGKPYIANAKLQFNVSDSHDIAVYALTLNKNIGIDVEMLRDGIMAEELVARFFAAEESAMLQALPEPARQRAFFNGWTRKEAYLKAIGKGLAFALDQFVVTLAPDEPAKILRIQDSVSAAEKWQLFDLKILPGYVAALVIESS